MKSVYFEIAGTPQGKGRPRFTKSGRAYTPAKTVKYERQIVEAYKAAIESEYFGDAPIEVTIHAFFDLPKSTTKKRRQEIISKNEMVKKKPDADNIAKVVCDALNGIAYKDDAQIVDLHVLKWYALGDESAHVSVFISEVQ